MYHDIHVYVALSLYTALFYIKTEDLFGTCEKTEPGDIYFSVKEEVS